MRSSSGGLSVPTKPEIFRLMLSRGLARASDLRYDPNFAAVRVAASRTKLAIRCHENRERIGLFYYGVVRVQRNSNFPIAQRRPNPSTNTIHPERR